MKAESRKSWWLAILGSGFLLIAVPSISEEAYVVRIFTERYLTSATECLRVGWRDRLTFHNTTASAAEVRLLSASNGYTPPREDVLSLSPGRTQSLFVFPFQAHRSNAWAPQDPYVFLVDHLNVPTGIIVESRGEIYGGGADGLPLPCDPFLVGTTVFGSFALPVVRQLTPAGSPQFHLASDLGTIMSRTNIGIYNGAAVAAIASIEVHRSCDDGLIEMRTVPIPANSVIQSTGFINTPSGCLEGGSTPDHERYVIIRVDQPSFSFVTTIAQDLPPKISVSATSAR